MIADAFKLSVYFGESLTAGPLLASDALMAVLRPSTASTAATLLRGIEGFGINRRIHAERLPDVSTDLPLLAVAVDARERIRAILDDVDRAVPRGLVTLEEARLATGQDVARGRVPDGPRDGGEAHDLLRLGRAGGRRPAYREAVDAAAPLRSERSDRAAGRRRAAARADAAVHGSSRPMRARR